MKSSHELCESATINYTASEALTDSSSDEITFVFGQIFNQERDLFDRNAFLFNYLNKLVSEKNIDVIKKILENDSLLDSHPSILKTFLLMTESIKDKDGFHLLRNRIENRMNERLYSN